MPWFKIEELTLACADMFRWEVALTKDLAPCSWRMLLAFLEATGLGVVRTGLK